MKTKLFLFVILILTCSMVRAANITVPGSFNSIQEAINSASVGDTIIVSPGIYYENINFLGKNIVLTSLFYLSSDTSYISSTIINGSNPTSPDTGSCVIFSNYEDSMAVLQGFTITGGTGTKWLDIHGAGLFREGGGILIELSSPTIRFNIIKENIVTNMSGVTSTGGGAIRVGDGNPDISNNLIYNNQARYGAGIVLNYTGCKIRNNIITGNTGGQDYYGGSGIWINNNLPGNPKMIENNTITANDASAANGTGGITVWGAANVFIKNNIVYNNNPAVQIKTISSTPTVSFSNVQGGFAGIANIIADPMLAAGSYYPIAGSPCIDSGDNDPFYNDPEDPNNPGAALFPSSGSVTSDIGAYGGPGAKLLPFVATAVGIAEVKNSQVIGLYPNPSNGPFTLEATSLLHNAAINIYDQAGRLVFVSENLNGNKINLNTGQIENGIYMVKVTENDNVLMNSKLLIVRE